MRLISGKLGGRKLCSADVEGLRPAMSRTRESLFSMLEARGINWEETRVLDLFAGCGSLGMEALSRGARDCVFVDMAESQRKCLEKNAVALGMTSKSRIVKSPVQRFLRGAPPNFFDLVFIDPPYRRNLAETALAMLDDGGWLNPGAFIVAEVEKNANFGVPSSYTQEAERLFGQTSVRIWTRQ